MHSQKVSFQIGDTQDAQTQSLWQVCVDDVIVGECVCQKAGLVWDIVDIHIQESYRHRGLAARLLRHVLTEARRFACDEVFLEVRISNMAAIRLYESCQFQKQGVRKGYYSDGEDALIMKLVLL